MYIHLKVWEKAKGNQKRKQRISNFNGEVIFYIFINKMQLFIFSHVTFFQIYIYSICSCCSLFYIISYTILYDSAYKTRYSVYKICESIKGVVVRKKIRKRRLFKKVQAFCEEKVLRCLLGVFWYAESKNQCWQAEK